MALLRHPVTAILHYHRSLLKTFTQRQSRQLKAIGFGAAIYAQLCKEKEMPYPQLGPAGEILADEAWWQRMQLTRKGWAAQQDDPLDMEYPTDEV